MHVSSLAIEHFRGIRNARIDGIEQVNLLLGRNNAGKTSFLEALFLATGAGRPGRVEVIGRMRGLARGDESGYAGLFYRMDPSRPFVLAVDGRVRHQPLFDLPTPSGREGLPSDLVVQGTLVGDADADQPSLFGDTYEEQGFLYTDEDRARGVEFFVQGRLIGAEGARSASLWKAYERADGRRMFRGSPRVESSAELSQFEKSLFVQANAVDGALGSKVGELVVSKLTRPLVRTLQLVDDRIMDVALAERNQVYVDVGLPTLLPIGLMGEGIRRLISIVATIMSAEGSLVLIDEIDDGLHHSALSLLWRAVLDAAERYDVQVVATTHSREALEQLTEVLEQGEMRQHQGRVAAFDLVRAPDDTVRSYRYDFDQLDFALEHDHDVRS